MGILVKITVFDDVKAAAYKKFSFCFNRRLYTGLCTSLNSLNSIDCDKVLWKIVIWKRSLKFYKRSDNVWSFRFASLVTSCSGAVLSQIFLLNPPNFARPVFEFIYCLTWYIIRKLLH